MGLLFRAHPWHGIPVGDDFPALLRCYIEIVPSDTVKYELDKQTGILMIDRPQRYSSVCPELYGFIPRTYCAERVAALCPSSADNTSLVGDADPLDICVLCERQISHGDVFLEAVPIGGFSMLDGGEVDDKIIAVLRGDAVYGSWRDLADCPKPLLDRLEHYFVTYKQAPGSLTQVCEIAQHYGAAHARRVIEASHADYLDRFQDLEQALNAALRG